MDEGNLAIESDCDGAGDRKLIRARSADLAQLKDQTDWERVDRLSDPHCQYLLRQR